MRDDVLRLRFAVVSAVIFYEHASFAGDGDVHVHVNPVADSIVIGAALAGTLALSQLNVPRRRWSSELLAIDEPARGTRSSTDNAWSNVTIAATIALPMVAEATKADAQTGPKAVVYTETLALGLLLNSAAKYTVARPRPYTYRVGSKENEGDGDDAYVSFFSGHSTAAFSAAVSGSILYAYGESDKTKRAILWGTEMTLASSTAILRVRAGKHFPSDVVFGALVGTAAGILVPRAHVSPSQRSVYSPSLDEWAGIGIGLAAGSTLTLALPRPKATPGLGFIVAPDVSARGAGIKLLGPMF
jgi:membrane-associated phospholipid phosphatase